MKAFTFDLTLKDIRTLKDAAWLNDQIINIWMELLQQRNNEEFAGNQFGFSYYFSSFFHAKLVSNADGYCYEAVQRWTRRIDIFAMSNVFIPVNVDNVHWALAVINMIAKSITYYDSMGGKT
jgi:sentrin-specific protease 1